LYHCNLLWSDEDRWSELIEAAQGQQMRRTLRHVRTAEDPARQTMLNTSNITPTQTSVTHSHRTATFMEFPDFIKYFK